jgi:hypothetical protein
VAVFDRGGGREDSPTNVDFVAKVAVADNEVFGGRSRHGRQEAEAAGEEGTLLEEVASVDGGEVLLKVKYGAGYLLAL